MNNSWLFAADLIAKSTLLMLVATIANAALRHRPAAIRHHIWCLSFCGLLFLPLLSCVLPQWNLPLLPSIANGPPPFGDDEISEPHAEFTPPPVHDPVPYAQTAGLTMQTELVGYPDSGGRIAPEAARGVTVFDAATAKPTETRVSTGDTEIFSARIARPVPWTRIAVIAWSLGACAAFLPLLIGEIRNRMLRRTTNDIDDGSGLIRELSDALRLRRPVRWLESEQPVMPMTLGVVWPIVLFPATWKQWSRNRKRLVLMHELAHVKRFDVAFQLIARIVCALYWFHPLVWHGLKRLRVERELACDDCVLMAGARPSEYASELLEIARQFPAMSLPSAVAMAKSSNLEQRIGSMLDAARSHLPIRPAAARALVIVTALIVTTVAVINPAYVADDTATAEPDPQVEQAADADANEQITQAGVDRGQRADSVTVSGRVLLPTGEPAIGATVRAAVGMWAMLEDIVGSDYEPPRSETLTDKEGKYRLSFSTKPYGDLSRLDERWQEIWKKTSIAACLPGYGGQWVEFEEIEAEKDNLVLRLVDDIPLQGRVVDLEGNAVANVQIKIGGIQQGKDNRIETWLDAAKAGELPWTLADKASSSVDPALVDLSTSLKTDANGSFQIKGIGKDRLLNLAFEGAGTARESIKIVMRSIEPFERAIASSAQFGDPTETVFGAEFTFTTAPSRPITGTVRDAETGQPLAGVAVESYKRAGKPYSNDRVLKTTTDQQGRFLLGGMPKAGGNKIIVLPDDGQPYLIQQVDVPDPAGLDPVQVDVDLHRGILITGRVTDQVTGDPVHARLHYLPLRTNLFAQAVPEFTDGGNSHSDQTRYQTKPDGTYCLVGLPGAAVVGAESVHRGYRRGVGYHSLIEDKHADGEYIDTYRNPINPSPQWPNTMKKIDVADGIESVEIDFVMESGGTVPITILDAEGNPLRDVEVTGIGAGTYSTKTIPGHQFDAGNFGPGESRTILFRKDTLGWVQQVSASDTSGVTVKLQRIAKVHGRLLHQDHSPFSGVHVEAYPLPSAGFAKRLQGGTSDQQGRFEIELLPGANYLLQAEGSGIDLSATILRDLSIEPGVTNNLGELRLVGRNFEQVEHRKAGENAVEDDANANAAPTLESDRSADTAGPLEYRGMVVGPDGNPVAGAKLYFVIDTDEPKPEAISDSQGRFSFSVDRTDQRLSENKFSPYSNLVAVADGYGPAIHMSVVFEQSGQLWDEMSSNLRDYYRQLTKDSKPVLRLAKNDLPIRGHIVDSEGQPVENARVELDRVWYAASGSLDPWEKASRDPKADFYSLRTHAPLMLSGRHLASLIPAVSTGADGRFTVSGIGNERVVHLLVSAPGMETTLVKARTRSGRVFDVPHSWDSVDRMRERYYSNEFSLVLPGSVPIVGRITDAKTGEPIKGVVVSSASRRNYTSSGGEWPQAVSDDEGRYRLDGTPIGRQVIAVRPAEHHCYLPGGFSVTTKAGQDATRLDCQLQEGIWFEGSTLDDRTGTPLAGMVQYFVDNGNKHRQRFLPYGRGNAFHQAHVTSSGRFRIPVMPGRGIITFMADGADDFRRGVGAESISVPAGGVEMRGVGRSFSTRPYILVSTNANVLHEVNPSPGSDPVPVKLVATSGTTVRGRLLGPRGEPLAGGRVRADDSNPNHVYVDKETFEFQCRGYYPDRPRMIHFVHIEKNLAARLELSGEVPSGLTVHLQPAARITGRLVDSSGAPLVGVSLHGSNLVTRANGATELRYVTDDNGRFVLHGIVPGVKYGVSAVRDHMLLGIVLDQYSVDSPRTVDVGDIVPVHDHDVEGASIKVESKEPIVTVRGKVLSPNGKPLKSAQVWISGFGQSPRSWQRMRPSKVSWNRVAEADAAGRFEAKLESPDQKVQGNSLRSFTMVATAAGFGFASAELQLDSLDKEVTLRLVQDVPISGQIVTAEGTPASGVSIDVVTLPWELEDVEATVKSSPLSSGVFTNWPKLRGGPPGSATVQTDSSGRFRLSGMGADRFVRLEAIGGGIGATRLKIITRQTPADRLPSGAIAVREGLRESDYFANFVHIASASRTIKGTVTDDVSGQPIEGVQITAYGSWHARAYPAVTDARGRYELQGIPELAQYRLTFTPRTTSHLNKMQLPMDRGGNDPLLLNVTLHRGIVASGRLVDPETGDPVQGTVEYNPLFPNENWSKLGSEETATPASATSTDEQGFWQLGVLPGPGAIAVKTSGTRFINARVNRNELEALDENLEIPGDETEIRYLQPAAGDQTRGIMGLGQAVVLVNPSTGSSPLQVEHKLVTGRTRKGTIVDRSGAPVLGVEAVGLGSSEDKFRPKESAEFEVAGLVQGRKRLLLFLQRERQLGGKLEVTGDELTPLTARLTPTGTLTGRFVDELGRPLSTASVRLSIHDLDGTLMMTGHWGANVDSDGRFRIDGLIAGVKYRVDCQVPEHRVALYVPAEIQLESGQTKDIGEFTKENSFRFKPFKLAGKGTAEGR